MYQGLAGPGGTRLVASTRTPRVVSPLVISTLETYADATGEQPDLSWAATEDGVFYPIIADIPLMLGDFAHREDGPAGYSAEIPADEQIYYSRVAIEGIHDPRNEMFRFIAELPRDAESFLTEPLAWIDSAYDGVAHLTAHRHLAERLEGDVCQLGGSGVHAVKLLRAGARTACLVTPIFGELLVGAALARCAGVADRFFPILGAGEMIPLGQSSIDAVFCGGTLHHMDHERAGYELARVLAPRGRFAAAEPWRVPFLYTAGTKVLGKRERDVHCRPIDPARIKALSSSFDGVILTRRHGMLLRYLLLVLWKARIRPARRVIQRLLLREDAVTPRVLSGLGSSVSVCGERSA